MDSVVGGQIHVGLGILRPLGWIVAGGTGHYRRIAFEPDVDSKVGHVARIPNGVEYRVYAMVIGAVAVEVLDQEYDVVPVEIGNRARE